MRMFCTYCGRDFSRKEHLERHIPRHTNVKPYRCSDCNMSYSRKDLLQRHMAFHESRNQAEPLPGIIPSAPGRTPIACQNCAHAKTGCDKRVPCSRCAEKSLPCAARYARRSMKAAARAVQASATYNQQISGHGQHSVSQGLPECFRDMGGTLQSKSPPNIRSVSRSPPPNIDKHLPEIQQNYSPRQVPMPGPFRSTDMLTGPTGSLMSMSGDFSFGEPSYQDLITWPEYSMELDFNHELGFGPLGITVPNFAQLSDVSSSSDPQSALSRRSTHTRCTSKAEIDFPLKPMEVASPAATAISEFKEVIAAEAAWPLARCNPLIFSRTCPRTAIVHLECLEAKSKEESTWTPLENYLKLIHLEEADLATITPMTPRTRDTILAIMQTFLHKALEIHRGGGKGPPKTTPFVPECFRFLVLPPVKILEYFLYSFVRNLSLYFHLMPAGTLDPNDMVATSQASTLLVLLMFAYGAMAIPMTEARVLAAGLTETCRISLFDLIEKNVELCADPEVLKCALLFTILGAWSGDKWLMDIALGQRGMYLAMLRHAGVLEPCHTTTSPMNGVNDLGLLWRVWVKAEGQNRLAYNWVMVDQELSLFHDTAPILSITDIRCPLPGPEVLWVSGDASQWASNLHSLYGQELVIAPEVLSNSLLTPSLYSLFQEFLHDGLSQRRKSISAQQLRLLLHPIHSLLCHVRQLLCCFPDIEPGSPEVSRTLTKSGAQARLEETREILRNWYEVTRDFHKTNPDCQLTKINLILYHLISLNALTDFPEIERFARREDFQDSPWNISGRRRTWIWAREDALVHCGQIFRLLRLIPSDRWPCWSAAAIYRATLILWLDSTLRLHQTFSPTQLESSPNIGPTEIMPSLTAAEEASLAIPVGGSSFVIIDQLAYEEQPDPSSWRGEWIAALTLGDGTTMALDKPFDLLTYGTMLIADGPSTRLGDGIKRKLATMGRNWSGDELHDGALV